MSTDCYSYIRSKKKNSRFGSEIRLPIKQQDLEFVDHTTSKWTTPQGEDVQTSRITSTLPERFPDFRYADQTSSMMSRFSAVTSRSPVR